MCGTSSDSFFHSVDSITRRTMEHCTSGDTTEVKMVPKDSRSCRILFIPDLMIKFVAEKLMILGLVGFIMILCC